MSEEKKKDEFEEIKDGNNEGTSAGNNEEGNQDESGSQNSNGNNNDNNESSNGSEKKEKTFTQEQVNAMMTKEKKQGRAAAYRELGIDPKDEKRVAQFKAFVESTKTEDEKKAEEEANVFEKEKELAIANAKVEIMKQGVKAQYVDDAVALVMAQLDDDTDVNSVLSSFKAKYPVWFEPDKDDKHNVGQKGTGNVVKGNKKGSGSESGKGLGSRLAAQRKGTRKKSSYWS